MPRTRPSASASPGRLSPSLGSPATRTSSRSTTSASGTSARSSSWSTSPAARSQELTAAEGAQPAGARARVARAGGDGARRRAPGGRRPPRRQAGEPPARPAAAAVHVADFGIASAAGLDSLTQTGTVLGTASYLSPEQAQGERATPASDLYSLGVVAFELLTGRRPFEGDEHGRRGGRARHGPRSRPSATSIRRCRASSTRCSRRRSRRIRRSGTAAAPSSSPRFAARSRTPPARRA